MINQTGIAEAYFSTRIGGVSELEDCASMNLNMFKKLDIENSKINMKLFCDTIGFPVEKLVTNRELHSNNVRIVDERDILDDPYYEPSYTPCDGIITQSKNIWLYGYNSDCAIFMLLDSIKKVIAIAHAGWKGSINGILPNTIKAMCDNFGSNPKDILASCAPSIGVCCFEVDKPCVDMFIDYDKSFEKFIVPPTKNTEKYHIDLRGVNKSVLLSCGLLPEHIAISDHCTMCQDDLYYSYRRCKGTNGVNGIFLRLI